MKSGPHILTFEVTGREAGMTIRAFLREKLQFSGHQISRLKYQAEGIRVDGEKAYVNHVLSAGETLTIGLTQQVLRRDTEGGRPARIWEAPAPSLDRFPLQVLYEDEDLLIVDKPAGIVVHPSPGHYNDTLANQAAAHLGAVGKELDIRVTGRLDRETSGIVTFAQNTETAALIQRQRAEGTLIKTYIALAEGDFADESGVVDVPLRRKAAGESGVADVNGAADVPLRRKTPDDMRMEAAEDGKPARTFYRVLRRITGPDGQPRTLLACRIEHGRTHQIRVHMAHIGHPLAGDPLYGATQSHRCVESSRVQGDSLYGQMHLDSKSEAEPGAEQICAVSKVETPCEPMGLHAWKVTLRQPFTRALIEVEAPLPVWAARWISSQDFLEGR